MGNFFVAFLFICIPSLLFLFGLFLWKSRKIYAIECGHRTKIEDWAEAFGERVKIKVPVVKNKTLYCHKCLEKMTIRCAWCGRPIFVGSLITLYSSRDKCEKINDWAIQYDKELNSYIGCVRWDCTLMSVCDSAGRWYPPGKVHRIPSPLEISLADIRNGGDGIVIVNNLERS